jgi:GT2 family glycosyltransferase
MIKFRVFVSLVTYNNNPNEIKKILESLNHPQILIGIMDNSDNKIISKKIKGITRKYSNSQYRCLNENVGFGKAHNENIFNYGKNCDYICILNPDVKIQSDEILHLINTLKTLNQNTILSPLLLNKDGSIQSMVRLLPQSIFYYFFRLLSINQKNYANYTNSIHRVPFIHGACYLLQRKLFLSLQGFSKEFFLYCEDLDLCRKLYSYGGNCYVDSNCKIFHGYGRASRKEFKLFIIHLSSIISYFKKWGFFYDEKAKTVNQNFLKKFL